MGLAVSDPGPGFRWPLDTELLIVLEPGNTHAVRLMANNIFFVYIGQISFVLACVISTDAALIVLITIIIQHFCIFLDVLKHNIK